LSLAFLQKPKKSFMYFLTTGFLLGMLMGSKYSAPFYALALMFFYGKELFKKLSPSSLIAFLIPFFIFGLSWYIRNYINFHDPFYPQTFLFFKGDPRSVTYAWPFWKIIFLYSKELFNALMSEYLIWIIPMAIILPVAVFAFVKKGVTFFTKQKIFSLCLINILLFLLLPAPPAHNYNAVVFGIRYSYPALFLIIFLVFSLANKFRKAEIIGVVSFISAAFLLLPFSYHPKLVVIIAPLATACLVFVYILFVKFVKKH
jgi:hypothetical protein